jgi:hypothetical protein
MNKRIEQYYTFRLTEEQIKKFYEWQKGRKVTKAAAGEQYEFRFMPTGLGLITTIYDAVAKEELQLTNFDDW